MQKHFQRRHEPIRAPAIDELSAAAGQPHGSVFRFMLPAEEEPSEGARSHRVDVMRSVIVGQQGG